MKFNLDAYETVDSRIERFYAENPKGRIITDLKSDPNQLDEVVFCAYVYREGEDKASATGWASEKRGGSPVNAMSHVENGETSAIGRALANLNYKAKKDAPRPTQTEMSKADRYANSNAPAPQRANTGQWERPPRYPNGVDYPNEDTSEPTPSPARAQVTNTEALPTDRQIDLLSQLGYEGEMPTTRAEASQIIGRLKAQR